MINSEFHNRAKQIAIGIKATWPDWKKAAVSLGEDWRKTDREIIREFMCEGPTHSFKTQVFGGVYIGTKPSKQEHQGIQPILYRE